MKKNNTFRFAYFIFLTLLVILAIIFIIYVKTLLNNYESSQPETSIDYQFEMMSKYVDEGTLWEHYSKPAVYPSEYEANIDIYKEYEKMISSGELKYVPKLSSSSENETVYEVKYGSLSIAEIGLKANGPAKTKLIIFTTRDWKIDSIRLILEPHNYTCKVPDGFSVSVNGIKLDKITDVYEINGLYLEPDVVISDNNGNHAEYSVKGSRIVPEIYSYELTLPDTLKVYLNDNLLSGESTDMFMNKYSILELKEPDIKIQDLYGQKIDYSGSSDIPLTYINISAPEGYKIEVDGRSVPEEATTNGISPEYDPIKDFVSDLPSQLYYRIAVLKNDSSVIIKDSSGNIVDYDNSLHDINLLNKPSETIDPDLKTLIENAATNWSLLMSNDLPAFSNLSQYLIETSDLYKFAFDYLTGIDITFTSGHIVNSITVDISDYTKISENCFTVNVHLIKNMTLDTGEVLPDEMNEKMYFVNYDDPNDWSDYPVWKLGAMKSNVSSGR